MTSLALDNYAAASPLPAILSIRELTSAEIEMVGAGAWSWQTFTATVISTGVAGGVLGAVAVTAPITLTAVAVGFGVGFAYGAFSGAVGYSVFEVVNYAWDSWGS